MIHRYSRGWQDGSIYDEPVEGAFEALNKLAYKFNIVIFTTRATAGHECHWTGSGGVRYEGAQAVQMWMWHQMHETLGELAFSFVVTGEKIPAIAYIDDRAVRFTNWADVRKYWV